ncbi:NAD(P)-binding protein [Methylorubrum aminovorans]|nr:MULTISPECIES: NAD(P)-binding protein [unclassified Methylobacterium]QIJ77760.1 NAD(P)-binding protein [Methylobacterium sp. CLZ]QIJ82660.1 NAD(P)-binding protein [Methylobacterium sp. NI91]
MGNAFDVIIIGGGAAGIGATRRIAAHGASALLLEASSRLGGRAYTHIILRFRVHLITISSGCSEYRQ